MLVPFLASEVVTKLVPRDREHVAPKAGSPAKSITRFHALEERLLGKIFSGPCDLIVKESKHRCEVALKKVFPRPPVTSSPPLEKLQVSVHRREPNMTAN